MFFSFACELTARVTRVGVLTGIDPHALCTLFLGCTFCTLLGADGTSLDVFRKQLGILISPASPQPLPLQPSSPSLSLSLSLYHTPTWGVGTMITHWAFTCYAGVRTTNPPSRSPFPPAKPSHRTHHWEYISDCEKAALSLHACSSTISFLLSMFLFVFLK